MGVQHRAGYTEREQYWAPAEDRSLDSYPYGPMKLQLLYF